MAYKPGINNIANIAANIVVTNSAVLVTTGLTAQLSANQSVHFRAWIPFTVGATGGVRLLAAVPAGGTIYELTIKLFNTVAPSLTTAEQQAAAAFTNALANAGDHWLEVEGTVINGASAGSLDIQMAQNTADALSLTIKRGGTMAVTIF